MYNANMIKKKLLNENNATETFIYMKFIHSKLFSFQIAFTNL
jgi:hypothetical protein